MADETTAARWSVRPIRLDRHGGISDLSFMASRISIIAIVLLGTVASILAPLHVEQSWRGEYTIVAMSPRAAAPVTDTENRKRPLTETAITVSRRSSRTIVATPGYTPRLRPPQQYVLPTPPLPRAPELPGIPPRAPPVVC